LIWRNDGRDQRRLINTLGVQFGAHCIVMAMGKSKAAVIVGALIRSIILSVVILGVSLLVMSASPTLGVILMLVYAGYTLVRSSRKDTPLNILTAVLPGGAALACYLLQLGVSGIDDPIWPFAGAAIGLLPGWLLGRSHRIYLKGRQPFAHRTSRTILIWVLAYLISQGAMLLGLQQVTAIALGLGAFSTAMVVTLSAMLLRKTLMLRVRGPAAAGAVVASWGALIALAAGLALTALPQSRAHAATVVADAFEALLYVTRNISAPLPQVDGPRRTSFPRDIQVPPGFPASVASVQYLTSQRPASVVTVGLSYFPPPASTGVGSVAGLPPEWNCRILSGAPPGARITLCGSDNTGRFNAQAVMRKGNWRAEVYVYLAGEPRGVQAQAEQMATTVATQIARLLGDVRHVSESGGLAPPSPLGPQDLPRDLDIALDQIRSMLTGTGQYSQDAIAAAMAAALIQLLAGMGLAAASAAAQAAAAAAQAALDQATSAQATRVLDGQDAIDWLSDKRRGFLDPSGNATGDFRAWLSLTHSSANPTQLLGFAGDLDNNGNPTGHFAIVVADGGTPPPQPTSLGQPVEPESPTEPEPPPLQPEEPPPPEKPEPPDTPRPPVSPPPPRQPTKIEEPPAPEKPKDEERPEKKDKVQKEPCHDQWAHHEQICDECDALLAEVHRLEFEERALERAYYNKNASKWLCAIADTGNVIASILTAPLTTFAGSALASVAMTYGFEGLKLAIRRAFEQDASLKGALWSGAPSAGAAAAGGSLAWIMEAVAYASKPTGADRVALEKVAHLNFFRALGPIGSVATTAGYGGRDLYATHLDQWQIEQRLQTIAKLTKQSRWILKEAQERRAAADKALEDCLKRTL
jgi:hypothetical protein